jgi:hypothetical protein
LPTLVPANVPVYGYVYDESGRLNEVKTATEAGKTKTAC